MMSLDQKWQSCVLRDTSGGDNSLPGVGQLGLRQSSMFKEIRLVIVYIAGAAEVGLSELIRMLRRPILSEWIAPCNILQTPFVRSINGRPLNWSGIYLVPDRLTWPFDVAAVANYCEHPYTALRAPRALICYSFTGSHRCSPPRQHLITALC